MMPGRAYRTAKGDIWVVRDLTRDLLLLPESTRACL